MASLGDNYTYCMHIRTYMTVSAKTIPIGTFSKMRKHDLKYLICCGYVVLGLCSHARFTVYITRVVIKLVFYNYFC